MDIKKLLSLDDVFADVNRVFDSVEISEENIRNSQDYKDMVAGVVRNQDCIEDHFEEWYESHNVPSMSPGVAAKYMEFLKRKMGENYE